MTVIIFLIIFDVISAEPNGIMNSRPAHNEWPANVVFGILNEIKTKKNNVALISNIQICFTLIESVTSSVVNFVVCTAIYVVPLNWKRSFVSMFVLNRKLKKL